MKIKVLIFTITASLLLGNEINAQNVPSYVPSSGLVGWWPFNGNANDQSGNGNNGTVYGASLTSDKNSVSNTAYSFNGTSSYIQINLINALNTTNVNGLTLSGWTNMTSLSSQPQSIIFMVDNLNNGFNTGYDYTSTKLYGQAGNAGVGAPVFISSLNTVSSNNWYNLVMTCDFSTNTSKLYINGVLQSQTSATLITPLLTKIFIGSAYNQVWYQNGKLDDIGIWNRVLTQQEITALYNGCNFSNVNIVPNGVTTFCQGNSVSLNANKVNANYTYTWSLNGSPISGANSSSYIATQPGSYSLKIDSAGCSATSPAVNVNVNALPSINFSINPYINIQQNTFSLTATPTGGTYTGAGVTANGNFNPSLASLGAKTIYYTYTDGNNCTSLGSANTLVYDTIRCFITDTIKISVTDTLIINAKLTGLNPPNNLNTIKVYPNPANTHITIDYGNFVNMNGYKVKVVNMAGQTVFTTIINQQTSYIDVSTWSGKGIYFLQLIDTQNNTIENRKILLQ